MVPNGSAIYRAKVINDRDPERSGRLRVQVPDILGEGVTGWCDPCVPFNWFRVVRGHSLEPTDYVEKAVPKPGDVVWVTFEAGDVDRPVWLGTWRMSQADTGSEAHEATRIVIGDHTEFEAGYDPTTKADRTIYSEEPPASPTDGQFWYDLNNGLLYVWDTPDQVWLEVTADITVDDSWKEWRWPTDLTYIDGGFIGTNTLLANSIASKQIRTEHMRIGGGENMWPDPTFDHSTIDDFVATGDAGTWSVNVRGVGDGWVHSGKSAVRIDLSGVSGQGWFRGPGDDVGDPRKGIPVSEGEEFYLSFYYAANTSAANADINTYTNFWDADGNNISTQSLNMGKFRTGSWAKAEHRVVAPVNSAYMTPGCKVFDRGDTGIGFVDSFVVRRVLSASLIVDGWIQSGEGIRSANYDPGLGGWQIDGDGNAEYNNVTIRGVIDNPSIFIDDDQVFFRRNGVNVGSIYPPSNGGVILEAIDGSIVHSRIWIRDADEIQFHASSKYVFTYTNSVFVMYGNLRVSETTDLNGPVRRNSGSYPVPTPRGIDGGYSDFSGSGSDWGANIWSIGDSWSGTGEGSAFTISGGSSQYGLTWLRSTHASASVSEGLYIWRAGSRVAAFGLSGASLPYGISGSLDVSGNVSLSGSLYLGSSVIYESGGSYVYVKPTSSGNIAARLADSNATYTTGFPALGAQTTSSSPNVYSTSGGYLYRSTSSRKYKFDIEDLDPLYNHVLDLRPVWHRSLARHDKEGWSYWGFIAEEVDKIDPRLVHYNEESGEPEGVQYEKITVLLQEKVRKHEEMIADLQRELRELKETV